jgi:hypothetical protein
MSQNLKLYAALGIACLALALSVHTALRGSRGATAPGSAACVDPEARAQTALLRQALAERAAGLGRLGRTASAPDIAPSAPDTAPSTVEPAPRREPSEPRRRQYARFETRNPAVSVTQQVDGSYEIRTTDPSLAGSVMEVTAVTSSGEEDKVFIRVPQ